MTITTTSNLPPPIERSLAYRMLSTPTPTLIHNTAAIPIQMPAHGGLEVRMRRPNLLPTAPVPLGPLGITPPPVNPTALDIDSKMEFYGQWAAINEQVTLQNQDPVLNWVSQRLGVSMMQTDDQLTRDMLASSVAFVNCVNGTNPDFPTNLSETDVLLAVRKLVTANALTIAQSIEATNKFGTGPTPDSYIAMGHSDLIPDLENVRNFQKKNTYPDQGQTIPSEWGAVSNMRFLLTSFGSITPNASLNGNDVYNTFCAGMESYAVIEQDGFGHQLLYLPPQFSGPLMQNCSLGWKMATARAITQDTWILNLRSTNSYPLV